MAKAPAFQFYPQDFLVDTGLLSPAGVGVYTRLICYAWKGVRGLKQCHLPASDAELARMGGVSLEEWGEMREDILAYFTERGGTLIHERLLKELRKQEAYAKAKSEAGKRGADARWKLQEQDEFSAPTGTASNNNDHGTAIPPPMAKNGSSVFSLQSSTSVGRENKELSGGVVVPDPAPPPTDFESLIAYVGEKYRGSVLTVSRMPKAGAGWAHSLYATWGPRESLENRSVGADVRPEVLGLALMRYASDRDSWSTPAFKPFIVKANQNVREHLRAAEKDEETKSGTSSMQAEIAARDAAAKLKLEEEGRETPSLSPPALIQQLTKRMTLPDSRHSA